MEIPCYICGQCEEYQIKCIECERYVCNDHSHNYIDVCKECFLKQNSLKDWIEQEVNN